MRPLAAALLAAPLVACGGLASCGESARRASDPATSAVPAADLPEVGTVGDLPAPARSLTIAIRADGTFVTADGPVDYAGLSAHLRARAADPGMRMNDGINSRWYFVLRVHHRVPWEVVAWTLLACADVRVRAYRILFAVRPEDGSEVGGLASFFPLDGSMFGPDVVEDSPAVSLRLRPQPTPLDRSAVFGRLKALRSRIPARVEFHAEVEVGLGVAVADVLTVVDLAHRAGAASVNWVGAPPALPQGAHRPTPAGARTKIQEWVAAHPAQAGSTVLVGGRGVDAPEGAPRAEPPPTSRLYGLLAGAPEGETREDDGSDPLRGPVGAVGSPAEEAHDAPETDGLPLSRLAAGAGEGPEEAIEAGLDWLAAHQGQDGAWHGASAVRTCFRATTDAPLDDRRGALADDLEDSALATLAFLGAHHVPGGERRGGVPGLALGRGLEALLARQRDGAFGERDRPRFRATQAIATLVMVEAYARTQDEAWRTSAIAGFRVLGTLRREDDVATRAFIAWALRSARRLDRLAAGASKPAPFADVGGEPPPPPTPTDGSPEDVEGRLLESLARWQAGGEAWESWRALLVAGLVPAQRTEGDVCGVRGSWDSRGPEAQAKGRVHATAASVLCLLGDRLFARER